jgi:hypothetical protein
VANVLVVLAAIAAAAKTTWVVAGTAVSFVATYALELASAATFLTLGLALLLTPMPLRLVLELGLALLAGLSAELGAKYLSKLNL